jgi:hypothetical protein
MDESQSFSLRYVSAAYDCNVMMAYRVTPSRVTALCDSFLTVLDRKAWVYSLLWSSLPGQISFSSCSLMHARVFTLYAQGTCVFGDLVSLYMQVFGYLRYVS